MKRSENSSSAWSTRIISFFSVTSTVVVEWLCKRTGLPGTLPRKNHPAREWLQRLLCRPDDHGKLHMAFLNVHYILRGIACGRPSPFFRTQRHFSPDRSSQETVSHRRHGFWNSIFSGGEGHARIHFYQENARYTRIANLGFPRLFKIAHFLKTTRYTLRRSKCHRTEVGRNACTQQKGLPSLQKLGDVSFPQTWGR